MPSSDGLRGGGYLQRNQYIDSNGGRVQRWEIREVRAETYSAKSSTGQNGMRMPEGGDGLRSQVILSCWIRLTYGLLVELIVRARL